MLLHTVGSAYSDRQPASYIQQTFFSATLYILVNVLLMGPYCKVLQFFVMQHLGALHTHVWSFLPFCH